MLRSPSTVKPLPRWSRAKLIAYIGDWSPEGVAMCNYLLGCVRVDTRKSQDNGMTQLRIKFPPVSPFREFRASSAYKLERERERERSMPVKLRTESVREYLASTTLITPVHTWYFSPSFWCRSDAPEPLYGETLTPLEESQSYCPHHLPEPQRG